MGAAERFSGVRTQVIRPDEQDDEQANGAKNNREGLLGIFRYLHHRHVVRELEARLCLFTFNRHVRIRHWSTFDFVHRVFGHDLEQLLLVVGHVARLGVENANGSNGKAVRAPQWNTGVKTESAFFQKRIIGKAWIASQIPHD